MPGPSSAASPAAAGAPGQGDLRTPDRLPQCESALLTRVIPSPCQRENALRTVQDSRPSGITQDRSVTSGSWSRRIDPVRSRSRAARRTASGTPCHGVAGIPENATALRRRAWVGAPLGGLQRCVREHSNARSSCSSRRCLARDRISGRQWEPHCWDRIPAVGRAGDHPARVRSEQGCSHSRYSSE